MMGRWFYGPYVGGDWWMMGIGMILQIVFWVIILYVAARFLRGAGLGACHGPREHGYPGHTDSAEEILRQRYAKGEITREQYRQMIEDLKK
ncbi:hypothetical protein Tfer_0802 [Thermincola ferriacetica]|uniref:SHOCT domain-containing protein n=2 Tax=Thermincola TaxID=278993 RepID=D5X9Z7_THEPJ|nr:MULTISPECIES: SHOCT domain-containing protein [Thermincola]ADG83130.1 Protein of unknown function DUF2078, membrane [Thermincola potens JR]KNZ70618.1 hypothetical protein Tfer_0802 [Thermincola ferriacetica]